MKCTKPKCTHERPCVVHSVHCRILEGVSVCIIPEEVRLTPKVLKGIRRIRQLAKRLHLGR